MMKYSHHPHFYPLLAHLLITVALFAASAHSAKADPTALLEHVLDNYDKRIRPHTGDGEERPVIVEMTIVLAILTELRENQQVASFVISHIQKWRDPGLVWDPRLFNGLKQIVVPQSLVWVPKMFIYNSMDTKEMLTENRYDLRVAYDGSVKVNIPQYVSCICRLTIEFCAIALASPLLNTNEMDVNTTQPPRDSYFAGNAEWAVMNVTVRHMRFLEDGEYRAEVHYILHLNRRPIYYITVIVAPTFMISSLSILGIFSPGSNDGPRSEKVSLGLGSLLAMTVLLDIVAAAMPKSNSIPLLGYYIIAVIVLNAVGIAINMAFLAMSRHMIQTSRLPSEWAYRQMRMRPKRPKPRSRFSIVPRGSSFGLETLGNSVIDEPEQAEVESSQEKNTAKNQLLPPGGNGDIHHHVTFPVSINQKKTTLVVTGAEEDSQMLVDSPDLLAIYKKLVEIGKTQIVFQRKIEKRRWKTLVEREWNRLFSRFDYLFLFIFESLNILVLFMFLRFSWLPVPELPEDFTL